MECGSRNLKFGSPSCNLMYWQTETGRQTHRETERQRDRETERRRDRETERQRDRETERQRGLRMDHDGFKWIMHGLGMDYVVLCIDNAWIMDGLCMGLHGLCMDYAWIAMNSAWITHELS
jgi:hypothetical protein